MRATAEPYVIRPSEFRRLADMIELLVPLGGVTQLTGKYEIRPGDYAAMQRT